MRRRDNWSLGFDGTNDYIQINDSNSLTINNEITLESWVKPKSYIEHSWMRVIAKNIRDYSLVVFDDSSLLADFIIGGDRYTPSIGGVDLNKWNHCVITYKDPNLKFYINGDLKRVYETGGGSIRTSSGDLYIGDWSADGGRAYQGNIDEVRIWNYARTQEEIQREMYSRLSDKYKDMPIRLMAYWDMQESNGTILEDKSGNGNTGTINGASWSEGKKFNWYLNEDIEVGESMHFDGEDDVIDLKNDVLGGLSTFTFGAWVYPEQFGEDKVIAGVSEQFILYYDIGNDNWRVLMKDSNGSNIDSGYVGNPELDKWVYITVTYDSSNNIILYINGSQIGSGSAYGYPVNSVSDNLLIGHDNNTHGCWNGYIKEVSVWNRVLTHDEINNIMYKKLSGDEYGLVEYWSLEDGKYSKITDYSKANNESLNEDGNDVTITIDSITVNENGWYKVSYGCNWVSVDANSRHIMRNWIEQNGSKIIPSENRCYIRNTSYGDSNSNSGTTLVYANTGDSLTLRGNKYIGISGITETREDNWIIAERVDKEIGLIYDSIGGQNYDGIDLVINLDSPVKLSDKYSLSGNKLSVNEGGWYKFYYSVNCESTNQDERQSIHSWLRKNGNKDVVCSDSYSYIRDYAYGSFNHQTGVGMVYLSKDDYLELMVRKDYQQYTGESIVLGDMSWLMLEEMETDEFLQIYNSNREQAIGSGNTEIISLDRRSYINLDRYSYSGSKIYFNESGLYEVSYSFGWDDRADGDRHRVNSWLTKNGSKLTPSEQRGYTRGCVGGRLSSNCCNYIYRFDKGDYIELNVSVIGGTIETMPASSYVSAKPISKMNLIKGKKGNQGVIDGAKSINISKKSLANKSMYFDGVDDWINTNLVTGDILNNGQLTYSCWMMGEETNEWDCLVGTRASNDFMITNSAGSGNASILVSDINDTNIQVISNKQIYDGVWHHIVGVWDNGEIYLYVDGMLVASDSGYVSMSTSTDYVGIGGENTRRYHNGNITEVRIWNYARTQEEIQEDMKDRLIWKYSDMPSGLVAYYPMLAGKGSILSDRSGNGNHATINGCKWVNESPRLGR